MLFPCDTHPRIYPLGDPNYAGIEDDYDMREEAHVSECGFSGNDCFASFVLGETE